MKQYNNLYTTQFDILNKDNVLTEYPYPQFKRDSYFSLNGLWKHKISKVEDLNNINDDILVPFPIESNASGVHKRLNKNELIIYKKEFSLPANFINDKTFIHFLGVDQIFYIILNGVKYDTITTLNLPTKIDISNSIKEHNELYVIVKDNLDVNLPFGKQSNNPKGIFYTPFSGIYFPVFIESVSDDYIKSVKFDTTTTDVTITIDSNSDIFDIKIYDEDTIITHQTNEKVIHFNINNPKTWSVEKPHLYNVEIKTKNDKITSYFGLREIKQIDGFIYLNNKKIFLNGVLDQGYYPEGIITPISYKNYEFDILTMKELGFNTLRKHIKVEMPYFYYLCDKLGMLVMQDFVNVGKYNFITKTAIPTLGLQKLSDKHCHKNPNLRENFYKCGEGLINYLHNTPSIIAYTIFNEGWGQFDSQNVYLNFKAKYPNLIFDTASGWFRGAKTDLDSYHLYFKNIDKIQSFDHPIFLSEFGALCNKVNNHAYGNDKVFGYKYFDTLEETQKAFVELYENKIIPYKDKLIGTIYTQLSDVEEEDNGLLTYDRKILKLDKETVKNTINKLN